MINWISFKHKKPTVKPYENYFRSKKILIFYGNDFDSAEIMTGYYEKGYYETNIKKEPKINKDYWEQVYDPSICDSLDIERALYWAEFNLPKKE